MDICVVDTNQGSLIRASSVFGMLWLQTHFEQDHWEALASNQVRLPLDDAKMLSEDAREAGLSLKKIPALSIFK